MLGDRNHAHNSVPRSLAALVAMAGLAATIGLTGCASAPSGDDGVNNGLAHMRPDGSADGGTDGIDAPKSGSELSEQEIADQLAWSLDALEGHLGGSTPALDDGTPESTPDTAEIDAADSGDAESAPIEVVAVDEPEEVDPEPVVEVDPEARAHELAAELEALIRETTDDPYTLAIRLAGLLAGEPDAAARLDGLVDRLPEDQRGVVRAVAGILADAGSDPAVVTEALVQQAAALDEARPVRIGRLALCSRVEGFGRYTELPSTGFVAGSPMRMIVYTEVEHFDRTPIGPERGGRANSRRPERGGMAIEEGWEVRLSQELQLYHEADGLLAWRRPEEVTAYRSRSKPRDYFIVDQIELPRTLTVGAYRLKVVLRDLADRSVDERIIPIRVVADPSLAAGNGRGGGSSTQYGG